MKTTRDSDRTNLKEDNESSISTNNENEKENVCKNQNHIYRERQTEIVRPVKTTTII